MEIWKDIEGYPDYEVSNLGRVMSYKREVPCILKEHLNKGYLQFRLYRGKKPRIRKPHKISRLVAKAFIPNPENKPQVNHINGVKTDDRVENLEWCTSWENTSHACRTGLMLMKLTSEEVREIRASKETPKILAKKYKVSPRHIGRIKRRERRIHD